LPSIHAFDFRFLSPIRLIPPYRATRYIYFSLSTFLSSMCSAPAMSFWRWLLFFYFWWIGEIFLLCGAVVSSLGLQLEFRGTRMLDLGYFVLKIEIMNVCSVFGFWLFGWNVWFCFLFCGK